MRSPDLTALPPAPPGKNGWPWTEGSRRLPGIMASGRPWPKISIVTPSFNQGSYIEETIRSVLLQGYPDFEYIITDGGSTDGAVDVIRKYEKWLTAWSSQPDRGQSHAINKGFAGATGEILAYINSDDLYEPGAFAIVAKAFLHDSAPDLLAGSCVCFDAGGVTRVFPAAWPENLAYFVSGTYRSTFAQPAAFWSRKIHQRVGGIDESLQYCFDREFFLRMGLAEASPLLLPDNLARFREHEGSKTTLDGIRFHRESIWITERHAGACGLSARLKRRIIRQIHIEIAYIEIFAKWRARGRFAAIRAFLSMICRYPESIGDRKILGQARRLFSFPARKVAELRRAPEDD